LWSLWARKTTIEASTPTTRKPTTVGADMTGMLMDRIEAMSEVWKVSGGLKTVDWGEKSRYSSGGAIPEGRKSM